MTPDRPPGARRALVALILAGLAVTPAHAARVRLNAPIHHDGQTFLSWVNPNGPGWTYRVYYSSAQIKSTSDLLTATLVGTVGDSTWYDRRLYALTGVLYPFRVDTTSAPLTSDQGLCVLTAPASRSAYYAVTAQAPGSIEERTVTPGTNGLVTPVIETLATPLPVYQHDLTLGTLFPYTARVYTLWTTPAATPLFAAMANRSSMPFDCAIVPGGAPPQSSLLVSMHARGGDFLQATMSTGYPGEWVLGLDDPIATRDLNTFWYGYHQNYDVTLYNNSPPTNGQVEDYTLRRVLFTVLWARSAFPIDTTRVYSYGISMGAIGGMLAAIRRPDLFAALMGIAGKYDFSFVTDPDPTSGFNPGNVLRDACDRLWGTVDDDLPSSEGFKTFQELNAGFMVNIIQPAWVPPLVAFNGKNDLVVGWAEKIGFLDAMRSARQGGTFFWDTRDHVNNTSAAWSPMQDPQWLYRFRTNVSFPALSSCSADGNPGDGTPASGDSVATINGCLAWDTTLVDEHGRWETTLWTRNLTTSWGPFPGPDSATVDVTPRRLQAFAGVADSAYAWDVTRLADGAVVQQGVVQGDAMGQVTVPGVTVYRGGSHLRIIALCNYTGITGVGPRGVPARLRLALAPNPVRGVALVRVGWPARGEGRLTLVDPAGRIVRVLRRGVASGDETLRLDTGGLPAGIYFLAAIQDGAVAVRRLAVLR